MRAPVRFAPDHLLVDLGTRVARVPALSGAPDCDLVVHLDDAAFEPPHAAEDIDVEALVRISALIERACEAEDLDVEFD